jgi:hypothetical protein
MPVVASSVLAGVIAGLGGALGCDAVCAEAQTQPSRSISNDAMTVRAVMELVSVIRRDPS